MAATSALLHVTALFLRRLMRWKPIAKLTQRELDEHQFSNRLVLYNSCGGPEIYPGCENDRAWHVHALQSGPPGWEKYLILPEIG
jgi:hypothetical protein